MTSPAGTSLVVRLDSDGDVLLSGPAVRAVAASSRRVAMLCGPAGAAAAALLPGVDEVITWRCPWVEPDAAPVDPASMWQVADCIRKLAPARALVLTSFHQSPLPTALLLRLAGVPWIGATSEDYPGSLLDLRHQLPATGLHEVERMLSLTTAAGMALPAGDDGRLAVRPPTRPVRLVRGPYVVVHPGASVPARAPDPDWARELVRRLVDGGCAVVVTGGPAETALSAHVAGADGLDLGGRTTLPELAAVLADAEAVVVGNTGPAHLAAAVGTPVVSLFAPVVPAERWRPWGVPYVLLGDQAAACAGTRARHCPTAGHPCLGQVEVNDAVAAVIRLRTARLEVA